MRGIIVLAFFNREVNHVVFFSLTLSLDPLVFVIFKP